MIVHLESWGIAEAAMTTIHTLCRTAGNRKRLLRRSERRRLMIESLESRVVLAVSAEEQYFIYRLNYARDNPVRFQLEQSLPVDLGYVQAKPPLAIVDSLFDAAEAKVNDMTARNYFAHLSPSGINANQLARMNGYALPQTLAVNGTTFVFNDSGNSIESLAGGTTTADAALNGLINSVGHRNHLLGITSVNQVYNEVGLGYAFSEPTTFRHYWAVFAATRNPSVRYATGVVYADANNNSKFDLNEGLAGVTVEIPALGLQTVSNAEGGWAIPVPDGEYEIQARGGSFSGISKVPVRIAGRSEAVDFRSGHAVGQLRFANWVNTAPTLDIAGNPTLSPVFATPGSVPPGTSVGALLGNALSDPDPAARKGMAVTGLTVVAGGKWQFNTGSDWRDFPAVSINNALLLREGDLVRFLPSTAAGSTTTGTATITYQGWDQATGTFGTQVNLSGATGGSTAFSSAQETASVNVLLSNRSPVLVPTGNRTLPSIAEDTSDSRGASVSEILGSTATDADAGTQLGIGVSALGGNGSWQYSLDQGATWQSFPALSVNNVLPLRGFDRLRFVPSLNFNGQSTIDYFAWDEFSGRAGTVISRVAPVPSGHQSSFSSASDRARISVTALNDAPTIASGVTSWLNPIAANTAFSGNGGTLVADILGQADSDPDVGALRGIAVTGTTGSGTWWYQNNGSWRSGSASDSFAWLLKSTDRVQFVPASNMTGTATITFRAWDQTTGQEIQGIWANVATPDKFGGTKAYSAQKQVGTIFVGSVGAAPSMLSLRRLDPVQATGGQVRFTVSFSEAVNNVSAQDFRLSTTGSARGVIASVSGQGASYVVTVNQLAGDGTLGLELNTAHDIRNGQGVAASSVLPSINETYRLSPTVTLTRNRSSIGEGGGVSNFTATLSSPHTLPVTVALSFTGSARVDVDYRRTATQIVIPAGQTVGWISVIALQDQIDEANESIIVDIASVVNAAELGNQQVQTLIVDDDPAPSVTLTRNRSTIAEGGGVANFTATLSAVSELPVTVSLGFGGTATLGSDYSRSSNRIVIPAGQRSGWINVVAIQDAIDEPDESVIVDIIDVLNGLEATAQRATTRILDDDLPPPTVESLGFSNVQWLPQDSASSTVGSGLGAPTLVRPLTNELAEVRLAVPEGEAARVVVGAAVNQTKPRFRSEAIDEVMVASVKPSDGIDDEDWSWLSSNMS